MAILQLRSAMVKIGGLFESHLVSEYGDMVLRLGGDVVRVV
jgi:hypothetical protein